MASGVTSMPLDTENAYLAGLLDGEAHIGITVAIQRPNGNEWRTHVVILTLANTHLDTLAWVQRTWPGSTLQMKRPTQPWLGPVGALRWSSARAAAVLRDTLPFMRIKAAQAALAIQFADELAARDRPTRMVTPEEWARREELRIGIRQLNRPDPSLVPEPYPAHRTEKTCTHCGTVFADPQATNRKYCSDRCRNAVSWQRFKAKHTTT
jgi:hypothetical protein